MKSFILSVFALFLFFGLSAQKLASIFGDHMVIQQGIHVPVWGTSSPGSLVKVDFAGFVSSTKTDNAGKWMVRLPVLDYGGPCDMKVMSADTIILRDIMVGEVWLASGQSNMEWAVGSGVGPNTDTEISMADFPGIRYFNVPRITAIVPLEDMELQKWQQVTPATVKNLSAVGYFFARDLHQHKKVAVGIISSSWGATSAEAWMSAEMLAAHPDFTQRVMGLDRDPEHWNEYVQKNYIAERTRDSLAKAAKEGIRMKVNMPEFDDSNWKKASAPIEFSEIGLPGYWGLVWFRKSFTLPEGFKEKDIVFSSGLLAREVTLYINGKEAGSSWNSNGVTNITAPSKYFKAGKNVVAIRMYVHWGNGRLGTKDALPALGSISGKINFQLDGEWRFSSTIEPSLPGWQNYYNHLTVQYNGRIAPLIPYGIKGVIWYQGENNAGKAYQYQTLFPMMIEDWRVQWGQGYMPFLFVQLANFKAKKEKPSDDDWAELREAQTKALRYPNIGMACAIDIGEADDIHPKNKLDVGKRLYLAARHVAYGENIVYSGPVYESMLIEGDRIRIRFSSVGKGLVVKGDKLKGFSLAADNHKFVWADAVVEGNEVVVSSEDVKAPVAVRYSWESNPDGNLYNKNGLPALPFRTDNIKMITQ